MKITKRQLRRIIKEEKRKLAEGNLESSMYDRRAKEQGYDALGSAENGKDIVNVPYQLFAELKEFLETIAGLKMKGSDFISKEAQRLQSEVTRQVRIR